MPALEPITTGRSSSDTESSIASDRLEEYDYDAAGPATEHAAPIELEKQTTANSTSSRVNQRAQSVVSRIRSREPGQIAKFSHSLSHTKTGPDVLVDFEGPDDPYHPKNWNFQKKCVTTVLYGMTTAGVLAIFFPASFKTGLIWNIFFWQ
jgi:hypothetical protein